MIRPKVLELFKLQLGELCSKSLQKPGIFTSSLIITRVARGYRTVIKYINGTYIISFRMLIVAKSEYFWRATEQSNLVYKQVATTRTSKLDNYTMASGAVFHCCSAKFDCPVTHQNLSLQLLRMIVKLACC